MKKQIHKSILLVFACLLGCFQVLTIAPLVTASGGYTLSFTTSGSAIADGKTALTIKAYADSGSSYKVTGYPICVSASGAGNTLSATSGTTTNAYAYFTLKSTVAGSKTITVTDCGSKVVSKTVAFEVPTETQTKTETTQSAPKTSTTTSESKPSTSSDTQPETTTPKVKPISTSQVYINDQQLSSMKDKLTVSNTEPVKFSGKTQPNYTINLYVFSEPKKYSIKADANGNWNLDVAGLPVGDHHAEIETVDSKTNTKSKRTKLLEFSVKGASTSVANPITANASTSGSGQLLRNALYAVGAAIAVAGVALTIISRYKPQLFASLKARISKLVPSKFRKSSPPNIPTDQNTTEDGPTPL